MVWKIIAGSITFFPNFETRNPKAPLKDPAQGTGVAGELHVSLDGHFFSL